MAMRTLCSGTGLAAHVQADRQSRDDANIPSNTGRWLLSRAALNCRHRTFSSAWAILKDGIVLPILTLHPKYQSV